MKICRQERIYAAEFLGLLIAGMMLAGGVILAGAKTFSTGGSWWFIFLGAGVGATIAGEFIKRRMERLVKMSREARGATAGQSNGKRIGFTLVEIMVAVTLVGILSSLAVPSLYSVRSKAQTAR